CVVACIERASSVASTAEASSAHRSVSDGGCSVILGPDAFFFVDPLGRLAASVFGAGRLSMSARAGSGGGGGGAAAGVVTGAAPPPAAPGAPYPASPMEACARRALPT